MHKVTKTNNKFNSTLKIIRLAGRVCVCVCVVLWGHSTLKPPYANSVYYLLPLLPKRVKQNFISARRVTAHTHRKDFWAQARARLRVHTIFSCNAIPFHLSTECTLTLFFSLSSFGSLTVRQRPGEPTGACLSVCLVCFCCEKEHEVTRGAVVRAVELCCCCSASLVLHSLCFCVDE